MNPRPSSRVLGNERGMALVAALLVVVVVSVIGATFIMTTRGERSIASNVHIARASLLSADAGVRTAQQVMANVAKARLDSLCSIWSGTGPIIDSPNTFFAGANLSYICGNPSFSTAMTISFNDSTLGVASQTYNYSYTITSTGNFGNGGQRQVQSTGVLRVSADRGNFADYLLYTNVHTLPDGTPIWFTSSTSFDGRVHTNGQLRFAYQPIFQDLVTSVNDKAWYWNNDATAHVELSASSNGTTDQPRFFGGFTRGAATIALPPNSYDQQAKALEITVTPGTPASNSAINARLGLSGSGAPPNGIYVVHDGSTNAMTGGLYVQGNLDEMVMVADTILHTQTYTMRQGGTTQTVVVDPTAGTTTVTTGASSVTYTGVPNGVAYVNGAVNSLKGPDRASGGVVVPALEARTQLLITATSDIVLQGDVTCQDFDISTNVLGIYSSAGSVRVGSSAPNDMYLDAFVMATGASNGAFTVDNYLSGSPRGTFHLRGGSITQFYGAFGTFDVNGTSTSGFNRDFHYDRRGLIPPSFPTTPRFAPNQPSARTLAWKEI